MKEAQSFFLFGFFLGMFLMTSILLLRDYLDRKFNEKEKLRNQKQEEENKRNPFIDKVLNLVLNSTIEDWLFENNPPKYKPISLKMIGKEIRLWGRSIYLGDDRVELANITSKESTLIQDKFYKLFGPLYDAKNIDRTNEELNKIFENTSGRN